MHKLQNKMLIYVILIGVLPMLLISFFYYNNKIDKVNEQLNDESKVIMERLDRVINLKTNRLQNTVDILFNDRELQRLLRETDLYENSEASAENQKSLGQILDKIFKVEQELETVVIFFKKGGVYVSGQPLLVNDPVRFKLEYGTAGDRPGVISWVGTRGNILSGTNNKKIVSGTVLRDNAYLNDMEHLADVYMIFSSTFFEYEDTATMQAVDDIYSKETQQIYAYDKNVNLIYSTVDLYDSNILSKTPLSVTQTVYDSESGNFDVTVEGKKYMMVYYTAQSTGWKFVRTVPYSLYKEKCTYIIYVTALTFVILFALWCLLNYFIVRKIVAPIQKIVQAMRNVEDENLDVVLKINSKDEFSIIGKQFNSMVVKIKMLLDRIQKEEQKRKESDVLMMEYQINPHFLYNTLAAIRIKALEGDQKKVAEMLLILGRFLRKTIVSCTKMICVESEVLNINDYISLMQLRYNNRIETKIEVSDDAKRLEIPSMLLQPIIENAVMHGLVDRIDADQPAYLNINVTRQDDCVLMSVWDNGRGMTSFEKEKILEELSLSDISNKEHNHHIGLKNIHNRVKMMFGDDYGIDIQSTLGEYTKVTVKLPVVSENATD